MSNITLSPGQTKVFDDIMRWHKDPHSRTFALAGYAGTGKSTLARMVADAISPHTAFAAYTGKAANVLREKGCVNAGTLHSWLYAITDHDRRVIRELEQQISEAHARGDLGTMDALVKTLEQKCAAFRKPKFQLNTESELKDAPLIIVDEFSMLPKKLIGDLERVGRKILYLGDPFQLPPIEGECPIQPDAFLTEIHRQALESPIIRASIAVREGRTLEYCDEPGFKFQPKSKIAPEEYAMAEQIIVGRNATRTAWNDRFRLRRGYEGKYPVAGDKLICLKNSPENNLFNGLIGYAMAPARNLDSDRYTLDFESGDERMHGLAVWRGDVEGKGSQYDGYDEQLKILERFDYGYAITCHKAMGSEFDSVLVYNEPFGSAEEKKRWIYTGISRAQKKCVLVEPKG